MVAQRTIDAKSFETLVELNTLMSDRQNCVKQTLSNKVDQLGQNHVLPASIAKCFTQQFRANAPASERPGVALVDVVNVKEIDIVVQYLANELGSASFIDWFPEIHIVNANGRNIQSVSVERVIVHGIFHNTVEVNSKQCFMGFAIL